MTLVGMIVGVFWFIKKPNIQQDLTLIAHGKDITQIQTDIRDIKKNHLAHMEKDISELKTSMVKVVTILDERLPHKK